jgi:hypothetical protein
MEGRTEGLHPQGITSTLGDKVHPWGQRVVSRHLLTTLDSNKLFMFLAKTVVPRCDISCSPYIHVISKQRTFIPGFKISCLGNFVRNRPQMVMQFSLKEIHFSQIGSKDISIVHEYHSYAKWPSIYLLIVTLFLASTAKAVSPFFRGLIPKFVEADQGPILRNFVSAQNFYG